MKISEKERLELKEDGFFAVRDSDRFSVRFSSGGGAFTGDQLMAIGRLANEFGDGNVVISSRLSAEVTGIRKEDIDKIRELADRAGLERSLSGPRIRTVTSCMGTYCVKGNFDTLGLARELNERYTKGKVDFLLANRFKICVGGCPNSCMKPSLNDFGIEGHKVPEYDSSRCHSCKVCQIEKHCPSRAISFVEGKVHVEKEQCRTCGVCRNKCPFHVFREDVETRFQIYLGGTWGRNSHMALPYPRLISREEIFPLLDKTLVWYRDHAVGKERFGLTLERVGFDKYVEDMEKEV